MMRNVTQWTDAMIDRLREIWLHMTAREAAADLGVSRSAVLGKAHRLRLPHKLPLEPKPENARRAAMDKNRRRRKRLLGCAVNAPKKPRSPVLSAASLAPKPAPDVTLRPIATRSAPARSIHPADVAHLVLCPGKPCQWPEGTPGRPGFHMCDEPSVMGRPYCPDHCARAYTKVPTWSGQSNGRSAGTHPGKW